MGGQFLQIFMDLLKDHPEYTVSRARFEAVRILREEKGSDGKAFGAQALTFTLAGNGGIHLCQPKP